MTKTQKDMAIKVLNYWYNIEFLSQKDIQFYKDYIKDAEKEREWDKKDETFSSKMELSNQNGNDRTVDLEVNKISYYRKEEIDPEESLAGIIERNTGDKICGAITFYLGSIKREPCIQYIFNHVNKPKSKPKNGNETTEDERPERSNSEIACISLQLNFEDNKCVYDENLPSLSLSPILWTISKIKNSKNKITNISDLDDSKYKEDVKDLEEKFLKNKPEITFSDLNALMDEIRKNYVIDDLIPLCLNQEDKQVTPYKNTFVFEFKTFNCDDAKSREESGELYFGLDKSLFSNDIKTVLKQYEDGTLTSKFMGEDLTRYILAKISSSEPENKRIDLLTPLEGTDSYKLFDEILSLEHAPLGKWPSKYMPALMQEVAINIAVDEKKESPFNKVGNIFSVNGPPGTGKTTMLKEIVVNNVIERARLLSNYEKADDAFNKEHFCDGEVPVEHTKADKSYTKFVPYWYKLKDDKINDYSMLVASCNNAAVENISKDLPKSIIEDLDPSSEIYTLFDPKNPDYFENIKGKRIENLYFTKYAWELLKDKDQNAWGVISAALGNKAHVSDFYKHFLSHLLEDLLNSNSDLEPHKNKYCRAKEAFQNQLDKVLEEREKIKKIENLHKQVVEQEKKKNNFSGYMVSCIACKKELEAINEKIIDAKNMEQELKNEKDSLTNRKNLKRVKACITKILNNGGKNEAKEDIDRLDEQVSNIQKKLDALKIEELKKQEQEKIEESKELVNQISSILVADYNIKITPKNIDDLILSMDRIWPEVNDAYNQSLKQYESEKQKFMAGQKANSAVIPDEEFFSTALQKEGADSTKNHVKNPWFTENYNREREKLFASALQMNKEFVLSSKCCRRNLQTLSSYWGMGENELKPNKFSPKDRERMVPALFQTLFLVVPVLSTTFASVGNMLQDVKQPGTIGMLIVDEAGQAQPQMAVGALYRSRKAVIVGDPQQVEPVVTEDIKSIQRMAADTDLLPYQDDKLSVQTLADQMNCFGTYLADEEGNEQWMGCPLIVHRRCIEPMFEISNEISYNGFMKQQTPPPEKKDEINFIDQKSKWINVPGLEEPGKKNHCVHAQLQEVGRLLNISFTKKKVKSKDKEELFIITPFTSVKNNLIKYIEDSNSGLDHDFPGNSIDKEYVEARIGTVHTFQGKEANEVIFVLGCDKNTNCKTIQWVNSNIVNVAVTRAKYRLYIIGDAEVWSQSKWLQIAKKHLDTYYIKKLQIDSEDSNTSEDELVRDVKNLPEIGSSFGLLEGSEDPNEDTDSADTDRDVNTQSLVKSLIESGFAFDRLMDEQLAVFAGPERVEDLKKLSQNIKDNLGVGMALYFLIEPIAKDNVDFDCSCCAILFCKALELKIKESFTESFKRTDPFCKYKIKSIKRNGERIPLESADDKDLKRLTLGEFENIIDANKKSLAKKTNHGEAKYNEQWWASFKNELDKCRKIRNRCCHTDQLSWSDQDNLLHYLFKTDNELDGLLFESEIGKQIE